jgi:hypothetical protein
MREPIYSLPWSPNAAWKNSKRGSRRHHIPKNGLMRQFMVTADSHLTAVKVFIGSAKKAQELEVKLSKKKMKDFLDFTDQEEEAKLLLEKECDDDALKVSKLESLLKWKLNVKTSPKDLKVKPGEHAKWIEIKGHPGTVSTAAEWTLEDQSKLDKFERGDITIEETVLGQKQQEKKTNPCTMLNHWMVLSLLG